MKLRTASLLSLVAVGAIFLKTNSYAPRVFAAEEFTGSESKIHKFCLEAKDYAGCVQTLSGGESRQRLIHSRGADLAEGNQCPAGYAYIGAGNCKQVYCEYVGISLGNDPIVAGKSSWKCPWKFPYGGGELRLGGVLRATTNPSCPPREPQIGFNSSCEYGEAKER